MRAVLVVAGLVVLVLSALLAAVERTLPAHDAIVRLPGLHAPVAVVFDRYGVPRIKASSDDDAAEALGFIHARDRMMQMDLMRRAAAGELSELIGPAGLKLDESARVLGTEAAAADSLASLPLATRNVLDAYSRGVNAFIAARGRFAAPEYVALGRPRTWRPLDSVLWAETMGLALSDNLFVELGRLGLSDHLSRDAILALWPVTAAAPVDQARLDDAPGLDVLARATERILPRFPDTFTLPSDASNAWAVDGRHTATGAPLLAGDPHLSYGLPCLWYLARIDTPSTTLAGATAPGTPFVVLGRNRRIAWTFTTTGADTEDLFVERTTDASHYDSPWGPQSFRRRSERIRVRGHPDVVIEVRSTRHGPVISDLPGLFGIASPAGGAVIAASIASLLPGNQAARGLELLDHASSVAQAGQAAAVLTAPVQNLLVADRSGIGLFTTGRVPIRRSGDGSMASPGWDGLHDWTGFASGADLPVSLSPTSGILVNANEPVSGTSSTVFLSRDTFGDWRSRRIRQLLDAPSRRWSIDDFTAMQGDVVSAYMADLLPILRTVQPRDISSGIAYRLLADWNGIMAIDQPQPLIAEAWLAALGRALAHDAHDDAQEAIAPLTFVSHALKTGCGSSCADLLSTTLSDAVARLARAYGRDPASWRWGDAHRAMFSNPIWGGLPIIGRLSRASLPVGGDSSTIDAQGSVGLGPDFPAVHGASFRGVYDLSNLDHSRFVIATGQSGNPFSRHLLDLCDRWQAIHTITIGRDDDGSGGWLRLVPAP